MLEIDSKFMIWPWKDDGKETVLSQANQIPTTLQELRAYFNHANPKPKGEPIYMNIWVLMHLTHNQMLSEN